MSTSVNNSNKKRIVDHSGLKTAIEISRDSNNSLIVKGPPGIGKSDVIKSKSEEIANSLGKKLVKWSEISDDRKVRIREKEEDLDDIYVLFDRRLSDNDSTDIKGIPLLNSDVAKYMPPSWLKVACIDELHGTIFLDEFNAAPNSVQKSFYQIIYDRMIGDYVLSDNMLIVGAGNRIGEDRARINRMDLPLRNRVNWVELEPPEPKEWVKWADRNSIDERIISYIDTIGGEDLINIEDNKESDSFPTPRTWEIASENIIDYDDMRKVELGVSMAVGKPVSNKFITFLEDKNDLNIEEYIENPEKIVVVSRDKQNIIMNEIALKSRESDKMLQGALDISYELNKKDSSDLSIVQLRKCKDKIGKKEFRDRLSAENIQNIDKYKEIQDDNIDILNG